MIAKLTLQYWQDEEWYIGKLQEVPGIFSQGKTLQELEENIRDAYKLVMSDYVLPKRSAHSKSILVRA